MYIRQVKRVESPDHIFRRHPTFVLFDHKVQAYAIFANPNGPAFVNAKGRTLSGY